MAGLKYVGAEYTEDGNSDDIVGKLDVDTEFQNATVSQQNVQAALNTAAAGYATQQSVNTALNSYAQSNYLTSGNNYTMEIVGSNVSGTYSLSFGGQTTLPIIAGATAAQVQLALSAFTNITGVTVAGVPGGPFVIGLSPVTPSTLVAISALTNGTININESQLIPTSWIGQSIAPLVSGVIPTQFIPSFGVGYCYGPFGATATASVANVESVQEKIADWNIGPVGIPFQPMCFMTLIASATNGGRPVVEVRLGSGNNTSQTYTNTTLVARGVGRTCWNDQIGQSITVLSIPSATGHTGVAGSGYPLTYNAWLSAWVYDENGVGVSVQSGNILNASIYFFRYQQ